MCLIGPFGKVSSILFEQRFLLELEELFLRWRYIRLTMNSVATF